MVRQYFLEICLGNVQNGRLSVRIHIVRAPVAVKNRHIAKPNAWLHIGQGDLFARDGGRTHPQCAHGAGKPSLRRLSTHGDQLTVTVALDVSAAQNIVLQ